MRSKTKCPHHQVISIYYKCVPTWEISHVPVKCDICKNVTILNPSNSNNNNNNNNYGFIHSSMYPKLYPRQTCHSLIRNRPDHFIVVYTVSGSIGLDRIQVESVNEQGFLMLRELLTGNLTTRLVITSPYDVNITVLTEDTYFYVNRKFLLYFYLVPKCFVILCANMTLPHYSPYNESGQFNPSSNTTSLLLPQTIHSQGPHPTTTTRTNNNYYFHTNATSMSSLSTSIAYNNMTTSSLFNSTYDHAIHNPNKHASTATTNKLSGKRISFINKLVGLKSSLPKMDSLNKCDLTEPRFFCYFMQ